MITTNNDSDDSATTVHTHSIGGNGFLYRGQLQSLNTPVTVRKKMDGRSGVRSGDNEIEAPDHESGPSNASILDSPQNQKRTTKSIRSKGRKTTKKKSKSWKKHPDKPKRPLSSYNIFFKHTRSRIISGLSDDDVTTPQEVTRAAIEAIIVANSTQPRVPRSNRKTHGQISFGDLARKIANQWKNLDPEQRAIYDHYASLDLKRYRSEVSLWKAKMEKKAMANSQREERGTEATEWTRMQSRDLEGSFCSSASEKTDSSLDQDFFTDAPQERMDTPLPLSFEIPSKLGEGSINTATKNLTQAFPTVCQISHPPDTMEKERNNNDSINRVTSMKNLQLLEEIHKCRKEINICEDQLSVMKATFEKDCASLIRRTTSLPTGGPSIERIQQLHLHRLQKGDSLLPFFDTGLHHHIHSNNISALNCDTEGMDINIDPVPLNEIFTSSVFDMC